MTLPTYDFTGKTAMVTGATGGMGRAITAALASAGANVMASDVSDVAGTALIAGLANLNAAVAFHVADVSHVDQVSALETATVERFGNIDYAVNAAAIEFETVPLADCSDDDFHRMMDVNTRGVFSCMKYQLLAMLAVEGGTGRSIVNIASTNSFRPQHNQPAYTASKHAVLGLTRSAALDYARRGIRVNAICPGAIDTPMLRNAMERRGRDADDTARRLSPLGRFGRPDEIAGAVL